MLTYELFIREEFFLRWWRLWNDERFVFLNSNLSSRGCLNLISNLATQGFVFLAQQVGCVLDRVAQGDSWRARS